MIILSEARMNLSERFGKAEIEFSSEYGDVEVKNIVTDVEKVTHGSLYVCIKGLRFDGHENIGNAIHRGAVCIVCEQVRDVFVGGAAIVKIENTRSGSARLYNAWYGDPAGRLRIVGVTGTNGKTSVCRILASVFEEAGYRCASIGTLGCVSVGGRVVDNAGDDKLANMTTPDPEVLYKLLYEVERDGAEFVFMEVSSHSLALCKCDAIRFEAAIFTNLTRDHLDFHLSMDEYFKAKKKLFSMCRTAIINADDTWGEQLLNDISVRALTTSCEKNGDYIAKDISFSENGNCSYKLCFDNKALPIKLNMGGRFAVNNTLQAACFALLCGIEADRVSFALSKIEGVSGRMERVSVGYDTGFSVIIDYAHTPDALENLLLGVRSYQKNGRVVLLFGCGGDRDRGKRKLMGIVASRLSDLVIITSDNSRNENKEDIILDILKGIDKEKPFVVISDRKEAIEYAVKNVRRGDVIVLAGKGHEKYEIDQTGRRPFDEKEIVRNAIYRYFPKETQV
jgi:UDP-N-acetylmuramoyl-L-alanyl-D-glutamate--2,6-diaminopimelate ligase